MDSVLLGFDELPKAIRKRIDRSGACWVWTGTIGRAGYGIFDTRQRDKGVGRNWLAHRLVWYLLIGRPLMIGEMPQNLHHECGERRCVNPDHLRPIKLADHQRLHHLQDACDKGHVFDAANTYVRKDGGRQCRACKAERQRERYRRDPAREIAARTQRRQRARAGSTLDG